MKNVRLTIKQYMGQEILHRITSVAFTIIVLTTASLSATPTSARTDRFVIDLEGKTVTLPTVITTIGTSWPGFINMLLTVDGGDKISVSTKTITNYPWAIKIFPQLTKSAFAFGKEISIEELAKAKPDVVFLRDGDPVDKVKELGIPVVMIKYPNNSIYDMGAAALLAGQVLGEKETVIATAYVEYLNRAIDRVSGVAKAVSATPRKVLVISVTAKELSAWGRNMPQNEVITLIGGVNVAAKDIDGYKPVSIEQILTWNPDVIIVEGNEADRAILDTNAWKGVSAVKNGKIAVSPLGIFAWARLGSELALYIPWLAKTVYPERYPMIDMLHETKSFYSEYFKYELTDDEARRILSAQPPL